MRVSSLSPHTRAILAAQHRRDEIGFVDDLGKWIETAVNDVGGWFAGAAKDIGKELTNIGLGWAVSALDDAIDWMAGAFNWLLDGPIFHIAAGVCAVIPGAQGAAVAIEAAYAVCVAAREVTDGVKGTKDALKQGAEKLGLKVNLEMTPDQARAKLDAIDAKAKAGDKRAKAQVQAAEFAAALATLADVYPEIVSQNKDLIKKDLRYPPVVRGIVALLQYLPSAPARVRPILMQQIGAMIQVGLPGEEAGALGLPAGNAWDRQRWTSNVNARGRPAMVKEILPTPTGGNFDASAQEKWEREYQARLASVERSWSPTAEDMVSNAKALAYFQKTKPLFNQVAVKTKPLMVQSILLRWPDRLDQLSAGWEIPTKILYWLTGRPYVAPKGMVKNSVVSAWNAWLPTDETFRTEGKTIDAWFKARKTDLAQAPAATRHLSSAGILAHWSDPQVRSAMQTHWSPPAGIWDDKNTVPERVATQEAAAGSDVASAAEQIAAAAVQAALVAATEAPRTRDGILVGSDGKSYGKGRWKRLGRGFDVVVLQDGTADLGTWVQA
ncbi:MAG: hypothetical protein KIT41_14250 [Pyrinomonadaceae bacterium]|nr:hypothetical protein [Pyrinomonadaceae bacterium]